MGIVAAMGLAVDTLKHRYPVSIVWTTVPFFSWLFPFIGHMGICTSTGIIRDFARSYRVHEDRMMFGNPVMYWQLNSAKVPGGPAKWDQAITNASNIYMERKHSVFNYNCYAHVALALNLMEYDRRKDWNATILGILILINGTFISFKAFLKTYLPAVIIYSVCVAVGYHFGVLGIVNDYYRSYLH